MIKKDNNTTRSIILVLIRLQELERRMESVGNRRLAPKERQAVEDYMNGMRKVIPEKVLSCYERLKHSKPELWDCPELCAVLALMLACDKSKIRPRSKWILFFDSVRRQARPNRAPKPRRTK